MGEVEFDGNDLRGRDPALADRVEAEIREALRREPTGYRCRIETRVAAGAIDSVAVLLAADDATFEWTLAPPFAPGDVRRATEQALAGRRTQSERRHPTRGALDRRRT